MTSYGRDLKYLMRKLLLGYRLYFDKDGVLNSDGRRLLEEIARFLIYEHPELKPLVRKVRKNPTLSNVIRLAEAFMSSEEIKELVEIGIYGLYKSSKDSSWRW